MAQDRPYPIEVLDSDLRSPHEVSRALRAARRRLGLTQRQVARAAGVSVQWLSAFENTKGDFGLGRILRLAETLGVSLAVHDRPTTDLDRVFEGLGGQGGR